MRFAAVMAIGLCLTTTGCSAIQDIFPGSYGENTQAVVNVQGPETALVGQTVTFTGQIEGEPSWAKVVSSKAQLLGGTTEQIIGVNATVKYIAPVPVKIPEDPSPYLPVSATFTPTATGVYKVWGREGSSSTKTLTVN